MERIACKECTSPYCHGCNMYRLERMLMSGKLDALMNENRAIKMDADVRPVVRGKWIKCRKNYSKCSECGTAYSHPVDWTPDKYCSECGARLFMED